MKTCTKTYYVDLWPGWQDSDYTPMLMAFPPTSALSEGQRRFRVEVPLLAFGGSAEAEEFKSEVPTVFEEVK